MNTHDISGKTFGYWTVLKKDEPHPGCRNSYWLCKCTCGEIRSVNRSTLVNGRSQSCGCKPSEKKKGINATHGMSKTRLYHEWVSMRRRCKSENTKDAKTYHDRGIMVCSDWEHSFEAFRDWAVNNGYTDSMTIDRIDNSKGYSPDNCRWVTIEEQQSNKTNNVFIDYNGEKWCLRTLCVKLDFPYKLAHRRYSRAVKAGKTIDAEQLLAPVHAEKIAKKYRH